MSGRAAACLIPAVEPSLSFPGDKALDGYSKKKYVCKLLFIFLLGHDIDFGHMEAVNLLSSNRYTEKQIVSVAAGRGGAGRDGIEEWLQVLTPLDQRGSAGTRSAVEGLLMRWHCTHVGQAPASGIFLDGPISSQSNIVSICLFQCYKVTFPSICPKT